MKCLVLLGLVGILITLSGCTFIFNEPPEEVYTLYYRWEYGGADWQWDLEVPKQLFRYYQQDTSRNRCTPSYCDWSKYVLDPDDDQYMGQVTAELRDAMEAEFGPGSALYYRILEFALNFVAAAIPYTADSRPDEWPRYPIETLVEERGDCEDTSILYASIARTLGYGAHLLLLPRHMATGVPADASYINTRDYPVGYYQYDGQYYVYAETIGDPPSYWRLGELPSHVKDIWTGGSWWFFDVSSRGISQFEPQIHQPAFEWDRGR